MKYWKIIGNPPAPPSAEEAANWFRLLRAALGADPELPGLAFVNENGDGFWIDATILRDRPDKARH